MLRNYIVITLIFGKPFKFKGLLRTEQSECARNDIT